MNDGRTLGRVLGAAMAAGFVIEGVSNFGWQPAIFGGAGFLENAGRQPVAVGLIIVLGLVAGLLSLLVAVAMAARYARDFPAIAWFNVALSAAALAATLVELSSFHAMRALSEQFAQAGPDAATRFAGAAALLRALRNGIHFSTKALEGAGVLSFFLLLWRARAVPRWLAGFGAVAAALQMVGVAQPLFARDVIYPLLGPLGLAYLATIGWLLARGLPPAAPTGA